MGTLVTDVSHLSNNSIYPGITASLETEKMCRQPYFLPHRSDYTEHKLYSLGRYWPPLELDHFCLKADARVSPKLALTNHMALALTLFMHKIKQWS